MWLYSHVVLQFVLHGGEVHGLLDVLPVGGELLAAHRLAERPAVLPLLQFQHQPSEHQVRTQSGTQSQVDAVRYTQSGTQSGTHTVRYTIGYTQVQYTVKYTHRYIQSGTHTFRYRYIYRYTVMSTHIHVHRYTQSGTYSQVHTIRYI